MLVDFNDAAVIKYQNERLDEGTAPKTINVAAFLTSETIQFSHSSCLIPGRLSCVFWGGLAKPRLKR